MSQSAGHREVSGAPFPTSSRLHHLLQEALQDFPRMSHYTHPSISSPSICLPHGIQVLLNIHFSASLIRLCSPGEREDLLSL